MVDLPLRQREILRAIVDRLIPDDETAGALALGIDATVLVRLPQIAALLVRADDFFLLDEVAQDRVLQRLQSDGDPLFARLVELVHEAFYADHRSWSGIGYSTHIPGRP